MNKKQPNKKTECLLLSDPNILKIEQIRDEAGKSKIAWVDHVSNEIKDHLETDLYTCDRCDTETYSPRGRPIFCDECGHKSTFTCFTPPEFEELWLPYGIEPFLNPLDDLPGEISSFIDDHLCLRNDYELEVLTRWNIASYRQDDFSHSPYLQFVGPIESGKTRALKIISLLSYRSILHAFVTPSALCREITLYHPTVCVDQAEQLFDRKNERGAEMYNIFMTGNEAGQKYMVASKESDNELVARDVFGFKAIASTRVFDEALSSRSIIFKMKEGEPKIKEIGEESITRAKHLRNKLLYWRLCQQELPAADHPEIIGRLKEIYTPLLKMREVTGWNNNALVDFIRKDEIEKEKEMADTFEAEILRKIKSQWESLRGEGSIDSPSRIVVKQLSEDPKERLIIGRKLKAMDIDRKHSREGNYIDLEDDKTTKQLKYLFGHFHIDRNFEVKQ